MSYNVALAEKQRLHLAFYNFDLRAFPCDHFYNILQSLAPRLYLSLDPLEMINNERYEYIYFDKSRDLKNHLVDSPAEGLEGSVIRRTIGLLDLLRGLLIRLVAYLVLRLDLLHARCVPQKFCEEKIAFLLLDDCYVDSLARVASGRIHRNAGIDNEILSSAETASTRLRNTYFLILSKNRIMNFSSNNRRARSVLNNKY